MKLSFEMISVTDLEPLPLNVRLSVDDEFIDELAETIKERGVLQPILVRPKGLGHYQIVAGEQRYRAACKAGLKKIPCLVKEMNDQDTFESSLIENLQRRDLSDYEVAKALTHLLKNYPEDYPHQKRLASKIGKSERWVSEYLAILDFRLSTIPEEKLRDLTHIKAAEIRSASNQKRQQLIQQIIDTGEIPSRREIIRMKKTLINTYNCPNCDADRAEWQCFSSQDGLRCTLCKTLVELVKTEEPQEPTQPIEEVEDVMMPIPLFKPSRLMDAFAEAQFESSLERLVGEGKIPSSGQNGIPISISTSWPNRCWVNEKIAIYLDDEEITEEGKDLNRKFDEVLIGRGWTVIREKYSSTMDEKALALVMEKLEKTFQKYKRIN